MKIGLEYIKGENVTKDLFEAKRWLEKAAIQDNEMAKAVLADLSTAPMRRLAPMGEFDKALIELRRSLYQAQEETRKNLLIYEMELEAELAEGRELYI